MTRQPPLTLGRKQISILIEKNKRQKKQEKNKHKQTIQPQKHLTNLSSLFLYLSPLIYHKIPMFFRFFDINASHKDSKYQNKELQRAEI